MGDTIACPLLIVQAKRPLRCRLKTAPWGQCREVDCLGFASLCECPEVREVELHRPSPAFDPPAYLLVRAER